MNTERTFLELLIYFKSKNMIKDFKIETKNEKIETVIFLNNGFAVLHSMNLKDKNLNDIDNFFKAAISASLKRKEEEYECIEFDKNNDNFVSITETIVLDSDKIKENSNTIFRNEVTEQEIKITLSKMLFGDKND